MRRVVVTGLGLVTPLACGVEETWSRLIAGQSGASAITKFRTDDLPTKIACQVPRGDGSDGSFNPDQWVDAKEQRRMDDFIIYGLAAAKQAVVDSGWEPKTEEERYRTGVLIGSGPTSHLFSQRGDYKNFRFRVEAQINDDGNSGQYFRTKFGPGHPDGYEAQINATHGDPVKTGSLYGFPECKITDMLVKPNTWILFMALLGWVGACPS